MNIHIRKLLIFLLIIIVRVPICAQNDLEMLQKEYHAAINNQDSDKLNELNSSFLDIANTTSIIEEKFTSLNYISQYYIFMDNYKESYNYSSLALQLWKNDEPRLASQKSYRSIYMMYNNLALYHITHDLDYITGCEYLIEGMKIAKVREDEDDYIVMGYNLIVTYFIRNDSSGLEFGRDIYNYGRESNNSYIEFVGAYGLAMMYLIGGELDQAEKYVLMAINYENKSINKGGVYNTYADILRGKLKYEEARKYYELAFENIGAFPTTTSCYVYLSYGDFLMDQGELQRAREILQIGADLVNSTHNRDFSYKIYLTLSQVYEKLGELEKSLYYYKKYDYEVQTLFNIETERTINALSLKYQSSIHEVEIRNKNNQIQIALLLIFVFIVTTIFTIIMYANKNKMYTKIVRQYKDTIDKESKTEQKIALLKERLESNESTSKYNSSLTEEKDKELFIKLEEYVKSSKIYKELNLTRERLAEAVDTNRTYLSQVINENAGKTVTQYINQYRISESLRILSDKNNTTPLKAIHIESGFNSQTTFYKLFQEQVGMTPAKYREKILKIS